jgi:LPXTG-motif cell wall-anchored protein
MEAYVFIPANFLPEFDKDTYVRADYFNKYDPTTAEAILNALAAQQTVGLSVLEPEQLLAAGIKFAKNLIEKRKAKVAAGTAKPIFGAGGIFKGKPGGFIDKIKGSQRRSNKPRPQKMRSRTAPAAAGSRCSRRAANERRFRTIYKAAAKILEFYDPNNPAARVTFFQKNKTLLLIGGAALIGGGIYLATRKKRR